MRALLCTLAFLSASAFGSTASTPPLCQREIAQAMREHGLKPVKIGVGSLSRRRFSHYATYREQGEWMVALFEVDAACQISEMGFVKPR